MMSGFAASYVADCTTERPGFMPDEPAEFADRANARPERQPSDGAAIPKDLKVKIKEQKLIVDWTDGTRAEYALADLRRNCPCASCRVERGKESENPLKILKSDPTGVRVTRAQLVGNYAIQFIWSDGHSTGIFDFSYLRSLARR